MTNRFWQLIVAAMVFSASVYAQNPAGMSPEQQEFRSLDEQVQGLKEDVIKINREMLLLQEKLLYPSSSQVSVFVSLEASNKFSLDAIELKLDNKTVQKHLYTYRELEALRKKGVQRLHTGNLNAGKHQLAVTVRGVTSGNSSYTKTAAFPIAKKNGPALVELRVVSSSGGKPDITLKEWQ
jgi:hypothetical protein